MAVGSMKEWVPPIQDQPFIDKSWATTPLGLWRQCAPLVLSRKFSARVPGSSNRSAPCHARMAMGVGQ